MSNENHGGANFAKTRGHKYKADKRYDRFAQDFQVMVAQHKIGDGHREANGYKKPGSRKKIH